MGGGCPENYEGRRHEENIRRRREELIGNKGRIYIYGYRGRRNRKETQR